VILPNKSEVASPLIVPKWSNRKILSTFNFLLPPSKMSGVICINCITGTLLPGEPKGSVEKIGGIDTYVAKPSRGADNNSKAIVSFTDVFGIGFKNNKIVGDLLAEQTGMVVYVPDVSIFRTHEH
jgi:hypothetical protein